MNLFFLIGNEGSGHHLIKAIFPFLETQPFHDMLSTYFDNTIDPEIKYYLKCHINDYVNNNKDINHIDRASFPYGNPRNSVRRYDIKEFYDLFKDNSNVNLFFIVIIRNIIHSTLSAYRRCHNNKDIVLTAKMQEDNLIYINSQMQLIPNDNYIIVDYNDICDNINEFEIILQQKSNIKNLFLNKKKVKKSENILKYCEHKHYTYLKTFFDTVRLKQFNFIYNNITQLCKI